MISAVSEGWATWEKIAFLVIIFSLIGGMGFLMQKYSEASGGDKEDDDKEE